jgi:hypothetical protein
LNHSSSSLATRSSTSRIRPGTEESPWYILNKINLVTNILSSDLEQKIVHDIFSTKYTVFSLRGKTALWIEVQLRKASFPPFRKMGTLISMHPKLEQRFLIPIRNSVSFGCRKK